jgi:NAD(P)-dependent dehydrogenase (short-subunit alcohol dehydrogenase family)
MHRPAPAQVARTAIPGQTGPISHRAPADGSRVVQFTPLCRFGGEEDLKGVAVLLASDASSYITGQIISVDGGMSAI